MLAGWDKILLLFLRVSGLVFSSPIFGRKNIPNVVKIGYCGCIAYLFYVTLGDLSVPLYNDDLIVFTVLCIKELMFGLVLGYVTNLFFTLTFTAGQMIDMQMGFGMVNIFDVQSNLSIPMIGNFLNIIMLLAFFAVDGHLRLLYIMRLSFDVIPLGAVAISPKTISLALEMFISCFILAVQVAMPIIGSGLLGEAAMGVLMRAVPQMNAFAIGLPLKVVMGFAVLVIVLPLYVNFLNPIFEDMYAGLQQMFASMGGV